MSSFRVHLADDEPDRPANRPLSTMEPGLRIQAIRKKRRWLRVLTIAAIVIGVLALIGATAGYFYWQRLKTTPQYSLALIVQAAKNNDQPTIDQLVDVNAVVDDFLPQITGKAVELYGRGLPPKTVEKIAQVSAPILPAIKDRARAELPRVIRERSERFGNVPFAAIVLGASRYLDIGINGDIAQITSKLADRPLEVKMKRNGDRWQIVGVKDEVLATQIAQKIGQEIIAIAKNGGVKNGGDKLGVKNLPDLLKQAEDLLNK